MPNADAGRSMWVTGLIVVGTAVVGNLALRAGGLALFEIRPEFAPLATAAPTILFTVVGVTAATVVFVLVRRSSARPGPLFRRVALVALAVSLVPDVWLLTEGAASAFPGATLPGVIVLMSQHVLAAGIVLWLLPVESAK